MLLKQILEIYELLDTPKASGRDVGALLGSRGCSDVVVETLTGRKGSTDGVRAVFPGTRGRTAGGSAPTLGIIGRLGGIGARPEVTGFVSDGDGALAALATALKLADMQRCGDQLAGDVIVATHVCPDAPTLEHEPVPFMDSPIDIAAMNAFEVTDTMDAILSIDATKGNRVLNQRGFAITPTVKEGYILRVSDDLLSIMEMVTGDAPVVLPITHQDITPYGNGVYHLNSILQPATATRAPVVGVAITAKAPVAGCASGATHCQDVERAAAFALETAKLFGRGACPFYDAAEYQRLVQLYGRMDRFQTMGTGLTDRLPSDKHGAAP